jgi:glycosyltransferase involved in cell wall biosynthesis
MIQIKPRFTIIMPTYNSSKYLVEAIDSIVNQTYPYFLLKIVDGGSSDLTSLICEEYIKKDHRISYTLVEGSSPVERFNLVLKQCETEFLAIMHSDDIQKPNRLELQLNAFLSDHELVMVGGKTFYWNHDLNPKRFYSGISIYPIYYNEIFVYLLFWWSFSNPTLSFRCQPLLNEKLFLDNTYRYSADWLLYWQIGKKFKICNINEILVNYRHHNNSEGPQNRIDLENESKEIRQKILAEAGVIEILNNKEVNLLLELKMEGGAITLCDGSIFDYLSLFFTLIKNSSKLNYLDKKVTLTILNHIIVKIVMKKLRDFVKRIIFVFS